MDVFIKLLGLIGALILTNKGTHGEDYNLVNPDGSFDFGYDTPDSYHHSQANRNNVVRGEFGSRSPETGGIDSVQYTAGPRGFRPRGKNIARKYDFNQAGPRPVGSIDDPYFDPSEDPSYNFAFNTGIYNRQEAANRLGDVAGKYSYLDDVGERHNVEFIAGKNTGFHVRTPFPDSNPRAIGPLYFNGRGRPIPRGRTSIQRGLDGSYKFVSAGPDQRRTETSDSTGHVRGSYTYLDDKGVQHAVHYIAGPETGYRVLKNVKGPHLPTVFPFSRPDILPADFYDYLAPDNVADLFDTAASGHVKPSKPLKPDNNKKDQPESDFNNGVDVSGLGDTNPNNVDNSSGSQNNKPVRRPFVNRRPIPSYDDDGFDVFNEDIFSPSKIKPGSVTSKPKPSKPLYEDDGSYKPTGDDGLYISNKYPTSTESNSAIFNPESYGNKQQGVTKTPTYGSASRDSSSPNSGTIVRNVGDRYFSIPPGAAVRAHVQAIDLLDIQGRSLSPSEQLKAESEEQHVENSDHKEEYSTPPTTVSPKETSTVKNATHIEPLPL